MRRIFSIFGIGFFVSVGYMDPGKWATDIAAGSQIGYKLLWVLVFSNFIAMALQSLTIYLGVYSGKNLAEVCKEKYPRFISKMLFVLAQIAIIATDLAELLGSAVALNLLFGIPILIGVLITVLDVLVILLLEEKDLKSYMLL